MENMSLRSVADCIIPRPWPNTWKAILAVIVPLVVTITFVKGRSDTGKSYPPRSKPAALIDQGTTAKLIEGAIKELALRPNIVKKFQDEMDERIGKRHLRLEDVEKLPYLNAFIKEYLRLHRTLTILLHLSAGPKVFPDPFVLKPVLKPERFLDWNPGLAGEGILLALHVHAHLNCTHVIAGCLARGYNITLPSDSTEDKKTLFDFIPKSSALEVCFNKRGGG